MDIAAACKTVRAWAEIFSCDGKPHTRPGSLTDAVTVIKAYLESQRLDGVPIAELVISEHLLMTRQGVRWVMPFVLAAESIDAARRANAGS